MEQLTSEEIERLLQRLLQNKNANARWRAAQKLEPLPESNERIVGTLMAAREIDPAPLVRRAAEQALLSSAHQAVMEQFPTAVEEAKAAAITQMQTRMHDAALTSAKGAAEKYRNMMIRGLLLATAGLIASVVMFLLASGGVCGGFYIVWTGAMLYGAYDFFRGFVGWLNHKDKEIRLRKRD